MFNLFKKKNHNLGLLGPDYKDPRTFQLASVQPTVVSLPNSFILRDKMTSIQRQVYGDCTSQMVDGVKEFLDSREYGKEIKLSQKFVYHNIKKISGLWNQDGDYLINAFKSVCNYGAPLETDWPSNPMKNWDEYVHDEPSAEIYKKAEEYKGETYWSVEKSLENFRQAIFQQKAPIGFGMMWYESYRTPASDGRLPVPNGKALGGHALIICDWDQEKLWIRNSHGTGWGFGGYGYIPFNEFDKHEIWNAYCLTDLPKIEESIGWVAEPFIKRLGPQFSVNEIVIPTCNLNLRSNPTTSSAKIKVLNPNEKLKIIEGGSEANGYKWWKIRKVENNEVENNIKEIKG